jgi:hypothetical protein
VRYRSRIVEVEAWHWLFIPEQESEPQWVIDALASNALEFWPHGNPADELAYRKQPHIAIETPEGRMRAKPGDYIVRGTEGELYPCKASVFERKYELCVEGDYVDWDAPNGETRVARVFVDNKEVCDVLRAKIGKDGWAEVMLSDPTTKKPLVIGSTGQLRTEIIRGDVRVEYLT